MPTIGKIVKAHGIRGDLKVLSFLDSPDCFSSIKKVTVKGQEYDVKSAKVMNDFVLLNLSGINTMTEAEELKNETVFCDKKFMPKITPDRFYIDDIIGCEVIVGEKSVGKIVDILQYGSADVVVVRGEKKVMFPWIKELNVRVDIDKKKFIVDPQKFSEVRVDED